MSTSATPGSQAPQPPLRIVYTDLDGTLLGPGGALFVAEGGGITERPGAALLALREAGVELVLMSGRTRRGLHEAARILGADAYIAELGGLLVIDGEIVRRSDVPTDAGGSQAIARAGAGALLLERFPGRLEPVAPWTEVSMMFQGFVDTAEAEDALATSGFAWLAFHDNGRLRRRLPNLDVPEVHAYHLLPAGITKASAVALHREHRGAAREETAAVGDSPADLEVAAEVGRFFLVANGRDAARDAGLPPNAIVTAASYGDGFAEAVTTLLGR